MDEESKQSVSIDTLRGMETCRIEALLDNIDDLLGCGSLDEECAVELVSNLVDLDRERATTSMELIVFAWLESH